MLFVFLISIGWPLAPQDSTHALGNNWGEYQDYGGSPYLHPGIDVMGMIVGKPVHAVQDGVVKAWLTTQAEWHWRLAIADYETSDSVEAWLYAHIDENQYHKNVGDAVSAGELIGYLVEWPITGFDHCHFARIKNAGAIWEYADWAFVQNPLAIIAPYNDTAKPVLENAMGSSKFAFCQDNTSIYLVPAYLNGDIDIIAKVYDETGLPLDYPVWERLIPYKIEYEIHGPQNQPAKLSYIFHGVLDYQSNVDVIYKQEPPCSTRGDYDYRDYYFIVTNTDGDSIVEATDAAESWHTTEFPDGNYWVIVTAYDAAGNYQRDSMIVGVDNLGVFEHDNNITRALFTVMPNPNAGSFTVETKDPVDIYSITGQLVASGKNSFKNFVPGIYFVVLSKDKDIFCQKVVILKK